MTSKGPRKVKSIYLEIFMPSQLDSDKLSALIKTAEECPVKLNLEETIDIQLRWK